MVLGDGGPEPLDRRGRLRDPAHARRVSGRPEALDEGSVLAEGFTQELCLAGREEMLKPTEDLLEEMKFA